MKNIKTRNEVNESNEDGKPFLIAMNVENKTGSYKLYRVFFTQSESQAFQEGRDMENNLGDGITFAEDVKSISETTAKKLF